MKRFLLIASQPTSIVGFRGALLSSIAEKNNEIFIIAPFDGYSEELELLEAKGYKVLSVPMQRTGANPLADIRTLFSLWKTIKKIKPDYVLGYTIKPVIYGSLAASMASVPSKYALITGLGYAFQNIDNQDSKKNIFQIVVFQLYKLALKQCEKVFFQNSDDLELFIDLKLVSQNAKTCVVNGSGVNILDYPFSPIKSLDSSEVISFIMVARLIGDKGVREYAQAAQRLKEKYGSNVQFNLAGGLDMNPTSISEQELNSWIEDGRLNYLGKLKDVRPSILDSQVFVLPSYREGTSRAALEAMSMGRAIITTDAPGCRQTVKEGYNGFLAKVKSVESLVESIEKIIAIRHEIPTMGKNSRLMIEEYYDVNKVNEVLLNEMRIG